MDQEKLDSAISSIAADIGPDAAEFTPPGQKNFLVEAALGSMAASFLYSFFKAVAGKATERVESKLGEKLGDAAADACLNLIDRLRHKLPQASPAEVKSAGEQAAAAIKQKGLSNAQIEAISKAVAEAMAKALAVRSDAEVSQRVSQTVSSEGVRALLQGQ
jgi:preprotein translocase subunit SecF